MRVEKQLSVFLENKPGTLAQMCQVLADAGVNVLALSVSDTVDHAVVRIVVDKPARALHLLGENGVLVIENDVLLVDVPNKPGALAETARKLSRAKLNIEYAYCTARDRQREGLLVLRVHNPARAMKALGG